MPNNALDLGRVFQAVAGSLLENRDQLNQADTIDQNHGDDMVEIFKLITQAMGETPGASPADQLARASELVRSRQSGTSRHYAAGLTGAAEQLKGKNLTADMAMQLVQTLVGGGRAAPAASTGGGDLLGALMGGLSGGTDGKVDSGDLLQAGLSFLSSPQGQQVLGGLMSSMTADPGGPPKDYRAQSGAVVTQTMLKVLGALGKR
jgi:hypothetical protein